MKVDVGGIKLDCVFDDRGAEPVVTFSHSLMASHRMWDPQMPALSGYRALRYDIRGHGGSDAPAGAYTLEELADDVVRLLDAHEVDRTVFVGLSLGGMIGQTLALAHADRLSGLVLADTASEPPGGSAAGWAERIRVAEAQGLEPLVAATLERWFTPAYLAREGPGVAGIREAIRATPVAGYVGCCHAIAGLGLTDRLAEIRTPTLVIVGEDDPGTPVSAAEAIAARVPDAELVVLEDARHLSNVEQPGAFNAALEAFLARVAG